MSVTNVHKDTERLTMTMTTEYDVPVERAWQLWNDPPKRFVAEDGFADENGIPSVTMPTMIMTVELTATAAGTTMTIHTAFPSLEAMEQLITMGMEEGLTLALGQIDAILATAGD